MWMYIDHTRGDESSIILLIFFLHIFVQTLFQVRGQSFIVFLSLQSRTPFFMYITHWNNCIPLLTNHQFSIFQVDFSYFYKIQFYSEIANISHVVQNEKEKKNDSKNSSRTTGVYETKSENSNHNFNLHSVINK